MTIIKLNPLEIYKNAKCFNADNIPAELQAYQQWTCWQLEQNPEPTKKPRKVPYSPLSGRRSGSSEKFRIGSWASFLVAVNAKEKADYAGLQFALSDSDPFVAVDFDHCVVDGIINDEVMAWVKKFNSYAEFSVSGTGIHIIARGKKPADRCKHNGIDFETEMYEQGRLIALTGNVLDGFHTIADANEVIYELYYDKLHVDLPPPLPVNKLELADIPSNDSELIERIRSSKGRNRFDDLMAGNTSAYASDTNAGHSEADLALCSILAFWTQKDPLRIDRIFRTSGLMRKKWDDKNGSGTYGSRTIETAIRHCREVYKGKSNKPADVVNIETASSKAALKKQNKLLIKNLVPPAFSPDEPLYNFDTPPWPDPAPMYSISQETGELRIGGFDGMVGELIAQSPIWIHSRAKNSFNEFFLVAQFYNYDKTLCTLPFPARLLSDKSGILAQQLRHMGMPLLSGKENAVNKYLDQMAKWNNNNCSHVAERIGWISLNDSPVFVLPSVVIGDTEKSGEVFYQPQLQQDTSFLTAAGSLQEWQQNVAEPCKKNPLLLFGLIASLTGCLNRIAKAESGGFHFYGSTSTGKTSILQVAATVYGNGSDPQYESDKTSIKKWKSTAAGLEAFAQLHNDISLCLDEVGSSKPEIVSDAIYLLTGGLPTGRSSASGGSKRQPSWNLMLLSTGELKIDQVIKQAGIEEQGGQRHRLPDIPTDSLPTGVVADPALTTDSARAEFIANLKVSCSKYYGTSGLTLISWIIAQIINKGLAKFTNELSIGINNYRDMLIDDQVIPSENRRMMHRLAVIGYCGRLACLLNILPFDHSYTDKAILAIKSLWLSDNDAYLSELERAIKYFKSGVLTNIANFWAIDPDPETESEFYARTPDSDKPPIKLFGYKTVNYIMILPTPFDQLCGLHSKKNILNYIKDNGFLLEGEQAKNGIKRLTKRTYLGYGVKERPRTYHIDRSFFSE